jgi:hypothetical protein
LRTINLVSEKEKLSAPGRIITREEYEALMFELAQETKPGRAAPLTPADDKLRKLEFNLMILEGLILLVFILCRTS